MTMFPPEWSEHATEGSLEWWEGTKLVPLATDSTEALSLISHFTRSSLPVRLLKLERIQKRRLWVEYKRFRDEVVAHRSEDGDAHERLLFHGTGAQPAIDTLSHPEGLDPRFAKGGFYGKGVYLAEDPAYPIGGRYAHRVAGSSGNQMQLLVVRVATGTPQELGTRIDEETKAMTMPAVRVASPSCIRFGCVRAGPHRPFASGMGGCGVDASIIYVIYESRQMYPAFVIEFELDVEKAFPVSGSFGGAASSAPPSGTSVARQGSLRTSVSSAKRQRVQVPQPHQSQKVLLEVLATGADGENITSFRMNLDSQFVKMMKVWCDETGIPLREAKFLHNGHELKETDTPELLGWTLARGTMKINCESRSTRR